MEFLIQRHGDNEAEQGGQSHNGDNPDQRVHHHRTEHRCRNGFHKIIEPDKSAHHAGLGNFAERKLKDNANGENHKDRHQQYAGKQPQIRLPLMTDKHRRTHCISSFGFSLRCVKSIAG